HSQEPQRTATPYSAKRPKGYWQLDLATIAWKNQQPRCHRNCSYSRSCRPSSDKVSPGRLRILVSTHERAFLRRGQIRRDNSLVDPVAERDHSDVQSTPGKPPD